MLTANKLERIMELEDNLKAQYQSQLDAKSAEIEGGIAKIESGIQDREKLQAKIDAQADTVRTQLETISALSEKAASNQRTEQLNRELNNRAEKLQDELAELKKRTKSLQKDLVKERDELKALKQFDPARMKKSLDANKKKLAEKTAANDLLQKAVNKAKAEKAELQRTVEELEEKLSSLEVAAETTEEGADLAAVAAPEETEAAAA
ncbi:MAG: DNA repair exonuclease SbcCD ATPase subunit [Halieaceae bacterium]|jgi:DNA repair exonuclease SbcCD ATPase subunit